MQPPARSNTVNIVAVAIALGVGILSLLLDWPGHHLVQLPRPSSPFIAVGGATVVLGIILYFLTRWFKHNRTYTPVQTRRIVEISLVAVVIMSIITGVRSILNLYK